MMGSRPRLRETYVVRVSRLYSTKFDQRDRPLGSPDRDGLVTAMRQLEDALEKTELVEHLQRRRNDAIAAKLTAEVGVPFQQRDGHALPCEKQREHEPGRPPADDTAARVLNSWDLREYRLLCVHKRVPPAGCLGDHPH